jgi:outer membrane immunogenic protein
LVGHRRGRCGSANCGTCIFIPNWTVKAEWLHYDLGTATYSNGSMNGLLNGTNTIAFTDVSSSSVKFTGDIVRAGLNYKF